MRDSISRRPAIDIGDFERRLRAPAAPRQSAGDPLSELARLMQGDEAPGPARNLDRIFSAGSPQRRVPQRDAAHEPDAYQIGLRGAIDENRGFGREAAPSQPGAGFAHAAPDPYPDPEPYGHSYHDPAPHDGRGADSGADAWEEDAAGFLDYGDYDAETLAPDEKRGRFGGLTGHLRPWHAVVGLSLIGVGAIAYGFAHRSGVVGSREIATIQAPEGPVKVPPPTETKANPDRPESAVLDRQEAAPVKGVVTHQEQPVEPAVEAQTQQPLLSEPKKVKTVSVRPDGTLIEDAPLPAAVAKAAEPTESPAVQATTTPKAPIKPVTTPKPEKPAPRAAKPKPAPKVAATAPQSPAAELPADGGDDAPAPEAASPPGKADFAVQFGAAGSEAEARALMAKIAAKYGSRLGGHRPTFKIAKVGEKTVYRVRVHGISKEAAAKVCNDVKAGGDACFVASAN